MKTSLKIIISQVTSLFVAYFIAGWLGGRSSGSLFDVGASGFIAFFYWPVVYVLLITFISSLWFLKINRWNYFVPTIVVLIFEILLGYGGDNFWFGIKYWLLAFFCGWILAKIVNFVVRFAKK